MMTFSRNQSFLGTTWAFRAFVKHHTEINDMYWSFVPTWSYANYIAKRNKTSTPAALFHASGPDVHRLDPTIPKFLNNYQLLANWVRLSALVSTLSYFETYLKKVVTLSLLSDPAVRFGKSRALEGVSWIKSGMKDDLEPLVTPCLKGDWCNRIDAYKRLFSCSPQSLDAKRTLLDDFRRIRNQVGHSYGRSLKTDLLETTVAPMVRLSEDRLKECFDVVHTVAKDIDSQLLSNHIGCFEEILFFHNWRDQLKGTERLDEGKHLRRALAQRLGGQHPGNTYCNELVAFYHSC